MKALFLGLLLPLTVSAGIVPPVIEKWSYSPDLTERCLVYEDHVIIDKGESFQVIPFYLKQEVYDLIEEARLDETHEIHADHCNTPHTSIIAQDVEIYDSGSCGISKKEKLGKAAQALRQVIDQFCPTTY